MKVKQSTTIQQQTEDHNAAALRFARTVAADLDNFGPAEIATARNTLTRLGKGAELSALKRRMGEP